ncbi:hypothetical protein J7E70_32905 [Variovorax paradoxus]|nr:hypothetical protein [Variovorax paradoxus]
MRSQAAKWTRCSSTTSPPPFLQSGKVRAVTVFAPNRIKALPDVPSSAEAGVPGGNVKVSFGVFGSPKTPPAVIAQVRQAVELAIEKPEMASMLENGGWSRCRSAASR